MKRLHVMFVALTLILPAAAAHASVLNGCMDCTSRFVQGIDGTATLQASCCMSLNGHCFDGDTIVEANVGFGCLTSPPDRDGNTSCQSTGNDTYCQSGGKKSPFATVLGGQSCVTDQYGWCDISCSSC